MQTFLTSTDFKANASILDRSRLGKQRVESKQITIALEDNRGWIYHPATKMWEGHVSALASYSAYICREWINRGYEDSLLPFFEARITGDARPYWLTDPVIFDRITTSHMASLYKKDPTHYAEFAVAVPYHNQAICCYSCGYYWPTHKGRDNYDRNKG